MISKQIAFFQASQVVAIRPHHFGTRERFPRRRLYPQYVQCRANRQFALMSTDGFQPDSANSSFPKLESDIREYLKTCPEAEISPLAYITLRNAGKIDLISRIMDAGGYIYVSQLLGVRVDENRFIPPPVTPSPKDEDSTDPVSDYNASLAIGRDLETRLDTIEDVMKDKSYKFSNEQNPIDPMAVVDKVPSGEQIRLQNEQLVPTIVDDPIPNGERFILTPGMRIGMLTLLTTLTIGFGRASHEILPNEIISACRSLAYIMGFAHTFLAFYAAAVLAPDQGRTVSLWFVKVLVGGPLGVRYLRSLGAIPD